MTCSRRSLQVMDDGRLTDGEGRTGVVQECRADHDLEHSGGRAGVEANFKPEFVNRLDDIVEFDVLTEQIGEIVELQVERGSSAGCASAGSRSS